MPSREYNNRLNLPPVIIWTVLAICLLPALFVLPYIENASGGTPVAAGFFRGIVGSPYLVYHTWLVFGIASALITGVLTLVDYTARKELSTLILGAVLVTVGSYDTFCLFSATVFPSSALLRDNYSSWLVSRVLHAVLLAICTVYFIVADKKDRNDNSRRKRTVQLLFPLFIILFVVSILLIEKVEELPGLSKENWFITHPYEIFILLIYLSIGFLIRPDVEQKFPTLFSRVVILSIIPFAFADAFMAVHKSQYDIFFNIACFLRFIAYLIPLTGIGLNYINIRKKESEYLMQLQVEVNERILIQKDLEEREALLASARTELENKITELKHSNSELEQFAYIASHDLQEPLRKIKAFGDRLQDRFGESLPEQGRFYIIKMRDAANRAQTLIDDLLALSKLRPDKEFVAINLNDIIRDVKLDLEYAVEKKNAQIEAKTDIEINAIPTQIRQLFLNLLSNSLKFSKPGRAPVIKITAQRLKGSQLISRLYSFNPGREYCAIEITDNGIGFDPQDAIKIFNLFHRLHNRSDFEGTGIGLALCRKIVENHSGYIEAEGKEGEGATIKVFLPFN